MYRKQMQRFAKIFELCVQSIISGGMREKENTKEKKSRERERERGRERRKPRRG